MSGLGQQKINYLLNRGQKVKFEDAWAIQEAVQKQVKWYELTEPNEFTQELMAESNLLDKMSISERVELGLVYEAELRSPPVGSVKGRIECDVAPASFISVILRPIIRPRKSNYRGFLSVWWRWI